MNNTEKQELGQQRASRNPVALVAIVISAFAVAHCYRLGVEELRRGVGADADADVDADADLNEDVAETDSHEPEPECTSDDDCDDGDPCTVETCSETGRCLHGFAASGEPCGDPEDRECTNPDSCDGAGLCKPNNMSSGSPCGDQGVPCAIDDQCDRDGRCIDNGFAAEGVQCADDTFCNGFETCAAGSCISGTNPCPSLTCQEDENRCVGCVQDSECPSCYRCEVAEGVCIPQPDGEDLKGDCADLDCFTGFCDGAGWCSYQGEGESCGEVADGECTGPDTCDGAGTCLANHWAADSPCGDLGTECQLQDVCDGSGSCQDSGFEPDGTPCGDDRNTDCTDPDTCDGAGECLDNHLPYLSGCNDGDSCTTGDECKEGDCVGELLDADNDGFVSDDCGGDDCNDTSHRANPEVPESEDARNCADGLDNDCDGDFDIDDTGCDGFCPGNCEGDADCVNCGEAQYCHPINDCCSECTGDGCACSLPLP